MHRLSQPSTWAGFGLIAQALAQLIASKGTDATAWASVIGGVAAVVVNEKATAQ